MSGSAPPRSALSAAVVRAREQGRLVVQPRMGMSDPVRMRQGLEATKDVPYATVGTITLDSYTRVGQLGHAAEALAAGAPLNGYPLLNHGAEVTRGVLAGIVDADFPVQLRHGSPDPRTIFAGMVEAGIHATVGGPVSYCLPYSRSPLRHSVKVWGAACDALALHCDGQAHVEVFGGCMLGQMCPPGLLVALSVLEGLFARAHGIGSISLSLAQQTSPEQDREALAALASLAREMLPGADVHIVLYCYMGVYPKTATGSERLLAEAVRLAVHGGADRFIVKTAAEAHRLPTIEDNVAALTTAARIAEDLGAEPVPAVTGTGLEDEARGIVNAVLNCAGTLDGALVTAFEKGILDIPYCLHPDNRGEARSYVDEDGRLRWARVGKLPLPQPPGAAARRINASRLLADLEYTATHFDHPELRAVEAHRRLPARSGQLDRE